MNELILGIVLLIIGLIITTIGGLKVNDGWEKLKNKDKETQEKTAFNVQSNNQSGGITAGKIDNVNITNIEQSNEEQIRKDAQTALIYQTEILHFLSKFKTCLHWTLPLNNDIDKDIDKTFNYGKNFAQGIDIENFNQDIIMSIFLKYDFRIIMPNYSGDGNFKPTGFNNLLGILDYFNEQLEKHLSKYGSSISTDLSTRIEYMQRMIQSTISSIRLDLKSSDRTTRQTASNIADLFVLMSVDYLDMKSNYTQNIKGGYPISIGKVTKSDANNGSIMVETQFSGY